MVHADLPLAVTSGEPAGIGPDLTLLAWTRRKALQLPAFYIRTDPGFLEQRAARLGLKVPIARVDPHEANGAFTKNLPVVSTGAAITDMPGVEQEAAADSVITSIRTCVEDVRAGRACAVVTNPITKSALYQAGFDYPGHTEYLGVLGDELWDVPSQRPVMLIAGPELMVVPVTIHIPLADVPRALSKTLIVETARIVHQDLKDRFGIADPRLAFCGLNPHAGENGTIGTEERELITPAIAQLNREGIVATGPYPADTLFHPEARASYDCAIGMYHDQVLVPAKTIGFDEAVNVTLGLPFVRTSPDHGTAYSLAGTGRARIDSFAASLRLAAVLSDPAAI